MNPHQQNKVDINVSGGLSTSVLHNVSNLLRP